MEVMRQISEGILVCPVTRLPLHFDKTTLMLVTEDGMRSYRLLEGHIPILLSNPALSEDYAKSSTRMVREYSPDYLRQQQRLLKHIKSAVTRDYRSKSAQLAFQEVIGSLGPDKVGISIGGGPQRVHSAVTNVNIAPFPNVDVVGDAHVLPYTSESVDAVYCDAVLEHLSDPIQAVKEMWRVLKRNGRAYVSTPFLQAYHGYPSHFQNFTLTGHQNLFKTEGFTIDAAGTCVGPSWVLVNMIGTYIYYYVPRPFNWVLGKLWGIIGIFIRPLDIRLNNHPNSYVMASTTYLVARKT